MKRASTFLIFFLALVSLTACDREWRGDIEGTVTDIKTGEPIAGVVVTASSMKNSYSISATTDASGYYRISGARWGPNKVATYHPQYHGLIRYADVIRNKTVTLDFQLELIPDSVDPVINVWVSDTSGNPIEGAHIDLFTGEKHFETHYTWIASDVTDGEGHARFEVTTFYENHIRFYRLKTVAVGYYDDTTDFSLLWSNPNPDIYISMEPIP